MYFSKVYLKVFSSKVFILKTTIILKKVFILKTTIILKKVFVRFY